MADRPPAARPAPGGRRRVAEVTSRRPSPLTLLAVAIPLLTVAALALVRPAATAPGRPRPRRARRLDRSTAVCPARLPGADTVRLGSSGLASGDVALRVGTKDATEALDAGVA